MKKNQYSVNQVESAALVVLSGGQDSTTCLYIAKRAHQFVYAITFAYGQRHSIELESARKISEIAKVPHETRTLIFPRNDALQEGSKEDLNNTTVVNLPVSFVPGRNVFFLTAAAVIAYQKGIRYIYTGTCQTDYCVPGSEVVITPTGKKTLEGVCVGERVLSASDAGDLSFQTITNKWYRGPRADVLEIFTEGGRSIRVTSNHKVFRVTRSNFNSSGGWEKTVAQVPATTLAVGDFLLTASSEHPLISPPTNSTEIDLLPFCDLGHPQLRYSSREIWFKATNKVFRHVPADDVVRLLAWYITEGSLGSGKESRANSYRVGIPQSIEENPKYYSEIKDLVKAWGFHVTECDSTNGTSVYFSGPTTKIFERCGTLSQSKRIPLELSFVQENLGELFETLMKGDGCSCTHAADESFQYSTKSAVLKEQICWLAQVLGYTVSSHYYPIKDIYNLSMRKGLKKHMHRIGNLKLVKILEIRLSSEFEDVFDIEVAENHNFVAGSGSGILVANSGYPDCRDATIKAINLSLNLAMDCNFEIITPLMWLTKADSVGLALEVGAMEALAWSTTCYEGKVPPCSYKGCVEYEETLDRGCPACKLRNKGFLEAGVIDPLWKRTHNVKKLR